MARRRRARNPDGTLVTPLSPKQLENLAAGRAKAAANLAGGATANEPETTAKPRRRVETVKHGKPAAARKPKATAKPAAPADHGEGEGAAAKKGFADRIADWLTAGE